MIKANSGSYEGVAKVACGKCGTVHEIYFAGDIDTPVYIALKHALKESGWDVKEVSCPQCREEEIIEENRKEELRDKTFMGSLSSYHDAEMEEFYDEELDDDEEEYNEDEEEWDELMEEFSDEDI